MLDNEHLTPDEIIIDKQRKAFYEQIRKRNLNDLKTVMDTPEGRRVIWKIMERGEAFKTCFDTNPILMAHKEGKRDIALSLLGELMQDLQQQYLQMCREAKSTKKNDELLLKSILEGENK